MDYIRGVTRNQVILFPESVEDYITADNPVRFIDAFVSSLDLAGLGFNRAQPAETGRPAYDPGDLLRLYLYGYLNRRSNVIAASRQRNRWAASLSSHVESVQDEPGNLRYRWYADRD